MRESKSTEVARAYLILSYLSAKTPRGSALAPGPHIPDPRSTERSLPSRCSRLLYVYLHRCCDEPGLIQSI